jgi:hypothetical protein
VKSDLAQAYFFYVVPQPGTPLYDLALTESPAALETLTLSEYNSTVPWYTAAYGVNVETMKKRAYLRFFILSPRRWIRLIRGMPWKNFVMEFRDFARYFIRGWRSDNEPLPEELQPLAHLYEADEDSLTSARSQRNQKIPRFASPRA